MWFWWFMLANSLLVPVVMAAGGRYMWKKTPQKINHIIGYRTSRSMKNQDTWKFAHEYCGKLWWRLGWLMLIPSVLVNIPFYGKSDDAVGTAGGILVAVQCIILVASIFPVEHALKKTFTDEGIRK